MKDSEPGEPSETPRGKREGTSQRRRRQRTKPAWHEPGTASPRPRGPTLNLTLEFLAPLRPDWEEQLLWTPCSGVDGDLSEEWSEPFSTMASPGASCGVGERERLRRIGEQAGVLRLELLAVLRGGHRAGLEHPPAATARAAQPQHTAAS